MKNTLKIQRAYLDITQAQLAEKVKCTTWTINQLESNKFVPSFVLASRIARFFGKRVDEVFIYEDGE